MPVLPFRDSIELEAMNDRILSRRSAAVMLALSAITIAVYWPAMSDEFCVFDDPSYVAGNPYVATGLRWENVRWALTRRHSAMWHPITSLSHMLDVQLFGLDPQAHHLVNLLLHVVNLNLLLVVVCRLTGSFGRSAIVAGLFALHPLHVESVAWISERKDVLSGSFFLLGIWAYTNYARAPSVGRYLPVLGWFILGMLSKPMLVTLPIVLLILDGWPLDRLRTSAQIRRAFLEKLPMVPVVLIVGLIAIWMQQAANAFFPVTLSQRIANALVSYMRYIGNTFWPTNLSIFYPHPGSWPMLSVVASGLALSFITWLAWALRRTRPYLLVGWLLYHVMLLPVIGLIQVGVQAMADRYMYLPLIGLAIMFVWFAADVLGRCLRLKQLRGLSFTILGVCALQTWIQAGYWRDNEALFTRALQVSGESAYMRSNLATAMWMHGRHAAAIEQRQRIVRANPHSDEAHRLLGMDYLAVGRTKEARRELEVALSLDSANQVTYLSLFQFFQTLGDRESAIALLREGIARSSYPEDLQITLRTLEAHP